MAEIALLDGGLGQEINKRSRKDTHPLWSVKVMFDAPDVVVDVHSDFIEAGAQVICLNTYTATPTRMERHDFGDKFEEAHATAFQLATTAISNTGHTAGSIQIAGCIPPLVASYESNVSKNYAESLMEYRRIVDQQKHSVDLFLIETMSNIDEASAALDAAMESTKPVYVGLTLSDDLSDTLRSGEDLEDAISALVPKKPNGILLNCSIPEAITKAMPILARAGVRFGGYANGFTSIDKLQPGGTVDVLEARKDLPPEAYAEYVEQWIDIGATIVGGCCEVGPNHIKYLANKLAASGHTISNLG
ncbi:MAG: homocysteine S-methyltransferase family protein [Rhodospirillales bacterium]|jgi:homocysteine S-methyltransferase|nr:homocysteine S-methyltransferase family protein [Rhodospirillales bacterium]